MMTKRSIILLVVIVFMAVGSVIAVNAQGDDEDDPALIEYIVIASGTANLRGGAGTNFDIVGTVSNGDSIFVYDEEPEAAGWYRVYREDEDDAYIADFLVERAPTRFYPIDQEPILVVSGRGSTITEAYDVPRGAYRVEIVAQGQEFSLSTIAVDGDCEDVEWINDWDLFANTLEMSTLLYSSGCSVLFEVDGLSGEWEFELRDMVDEDYYDDILLEIEDGTSITGEGHQVTMITEIPEGLWNVHALVDDSSFQVWAYVYDGECDSDLVHNEASFDDDTLDLTSAYRVAEDGCRIFWETGNVRGTWELIFEQIR